MAVGFIASATVFCACSDTRIAQSTDKRIGPRPMTVCDLLKNPTSYRGRMVAINGIYWFGLRQGCPEPFVTGNRSWTSAIALVDSDFVALDEPVAFKTDRKSWSRLEELIIREAKAGRTEEIWVTIVGQLQTPEVYVRKDGKVAGGYGHLGVFPAQIVVERISEVVIKANPTYDYSEILRGRHL